MSHEIFIIERKKESKSLYLIDDTMTCKREPKQKNKNIFFSRYFQREKNIYIYINNRENSIINRK